MAPVDRFPVAFVSHGAPTLALDARKGAELRAWARRLPRPRAVLAVSAHWVRTPPAVGTTETRPLIYDFSGFPEALYRIRYPAPGAPWLAERVRGLLQDAGVPVEDAPERGWDHGVWVPLLHFYPEADVPVLQISLPAGFGPEGVFGLGAALAPLRAEGVLIFTSGAVTHNLAAVDRNEGPPPSWAVAFDAWVRDTLASGDLEGLLRYREAPGFRESHPTDEHFLPLLVAAGAASTDRARASFPVEGFEFGSLSRRSVQFGG